MSSTTAIQPAAFALYKEHNYCCAIAKYTQMHTFLFRIKGELTSIPACNVWMAEKHPGEVSTAEQTNRQSTLFFPHYLSPLFMQSILTVHGEKSIYWETNNTRSKLCKLMLRFKPRSLLLWCDNWTTATPCKSFIPTLMCAFNVGCVTQLLYINILLKQA